jgi:hypothetical protein
MAMDLTAVIWDRHSGSGMEAGMAVTQVAMAVVTVEEIEAIESTALNNLSLPWW